jgi:hypothetical protein
VIPRFTETDDKVLVNALTGEVGYLPRRSAFTAIGKPTPRKYSGENEQPADDYPRKCSSRGLRTDPCVITGMPEITL